MLKSYPEHLLALARDGVIGPAALGHAVRGHQIEQAARRRAARIVEESTRQAEQTCQQARGDGHAQGCAEALAAAVPSLQALLADVAVLRRSLSAQLRQVVQDSFAAEGVDATLIVRRCEDLLDRHDALVLYLPEGDAPLAAALAERLAASAPALAAALQVRPAQVPRPLLVAGPVMVELDPAAAVLAALHPVLDLDALQATATGRGQAFASRFPAVSQGALAVPATHQEHADVA